MSDIPIRHINAGKGQIIMINSGQITLSSTIPGDDKCVVSFVIPADLAAEYLNLAEDDEALVIMCAPIFHLLCCFGCMLDGMLFTIPSGSFDILVEGLQRTNQELLSNSYKHIKGD